MALVFLAGCQTSAPNRHYATSAPDAAPQNAQARADFRLAQLQPAEGLAELKLRDGSLWLLAQPVMNRADIMLVEPRQTAQGQAYLRFRFTHDGARKLAAISQQYPGKLLVLTINDELIAAPQIPAGVNDGVLDVVLATEAQAMYIARALSAS